MMHMPTLLSETPVPPVQQPPRKRWTRAEVAVAEAAGVDLDRVELVEGELIRKMPKHRPQSSAVMRLLMWLVRCFGEQYVNQEAAIDVSPEDNPTNQPEPDLIVFHRDFNEFQDFPKPFDLRLVVEVADSSLAFDLTTKAALYARAEICEYWVLDVAAKRLIVHRNPIGGLYESVIAYSEQEKVAPVAAPHAEFPVASAFPAEK
jgi:Uma2 family endonuclease